MPNIFAQPKKSIFEQPEEPMPFAPQPSPVTEEPTEPTWKDVIYHSLRSGLGRYQASVFNVFRMIEKGTIKLEEPIVKALLPAKLEKGYKKRQYLAYDALTKIVKDSEAIATYSAEQAESKNKLKRLISTGLQPVPQIAGSIALGAGVPVPVGVAPTMATRAVQMIPFGTAAAGGYARDIEQEYEALGQEAPYWKMVVGGTLLGAGEMATELPVLMGVTRLLGGGKALVNKGAKTFIGKYGKAGMAWLGNVGREAWQEAQMVPIEKGIKQAIGLPKGWSIKPLVKEMGRGAYGGMAMALVMGGLGVGGATAYKTTQVIDNAIRNKEDARETIRKVADIIDEPVRGEVGGIRFPKEPKKPPAVPPVAPEVGVKPEDIKLSPADRKKLMTIADLRAYLIDPTPLGKGTEIHEAIEREIYFKTPSAGVTKTPAGHIEAIQAEVSYYRKLVPELNKYDTKDIDRVVIKRLEEKYGTAVYGNRLSKPIPFRAKNKTEQEIYNLVVNKLEKPTPPEKVIPEARELRPISRITETRKGYEWVKRGNQWYRVSETAEGKTFEDKVPLTKGKLLYLERNAKPYTYKQYIPEKPITPKVEERPVLREPRKAVRVFEPMPLKPAFVKKQVREVSGQTKVSEIIQVSERKLLADQLRIARKSAREGAIAGRKEAVLKARQHIVELQEKSKIRRELRTETKQKIRQLNTFLKVKMHPDYEEQIHALLGKYDLFRRQAKTLKTRESTRQFISRMEEQGETIYIPEDVLEKVNQIPLNDMSIDNLRDLHEQAKSIVHFGKLKNKLISGLEARDFSKVKQSMMQSIRTNFPKAKAPTPPKMLVPSERRGSGFFGRRKKTISGIIDSYFAIHKKAEAIIESLDGYKPLATVHRETFDKLAKSESKKDLLSRRLNQAVNDAFRYSGLDLLKADQLQDTIEGSDLTKLEQIAVYINSLNPDNRDGLRAFDWSDAKIDRIVNNLTPKEKRLGNRLMRIVGAQRQQLFSIGEKLLGRRPKPVKNYWPKIYDLELSDAAIQKKIESDLFKDVIARAYVERGFLKHRIKLERPVSLNLLRVLSGHLEKTTHFISHALEVRDTQKLIYDKEIKSEITRAVGRQEYKQIVSWLKHIANPEKGSFDWWDKAAGRLRANSTLAMLGVKVAISLKQGGSFTQTINRLGVEDATKGLVAFWKNPIKAQKFIYERSTEMRFRRTKFDRELRDWIKQHRRGWTPSKRQFLFTGIITVDKVATLPSWLGAYIKGVKLFKGDEKQMIKYADMVARRTQPAASPKDLPAIQRGTNLHKIFTMFYTHFTNVYNETARTTGMLRQRQIHIHDALVSYWWLLIAPAVFALYVSRPKKQTPRQVVKGIVGYGAAAFPIIGNLINTMLNPRYDYTMTPVAQLPRELVEISKGKKLATKARHATLAAGYLFGLPTPQMLITGTGIAQILKGETRNPMRLFLSEWSLRKEEKKPVVFKGFAPKKTNIFELPKKKKRRNIFER